MRGKFLRKLELLLFVLGLCFLAFLYGIAVGRYRFPPYLLIKEARSSARELWHWAELQVDQLGPSSKEGIPKDHPHVVIMHPSTLPSVRTVFTDDHDVTFITMFRGRRFGMFLVDKSGNIIHEWRIPEDLYSQILARKGLKLGLDQFQIHGAHLFHNGDVVFNVEHYALARIDSASNLLWAIHEPVHHTIHVDAEHTIWAQSGRLVRDRSKAYPHMEIPYDEELILKISPEGIVLDTISVLEAIYSGKYQGILLQGEQDFPETTQFDVTHLNDVEIIGEEFARTLDFVEPGDILISLRTIDSIAIIDRYTREVKWAMTGPFLRQHDPDLLPDGTISIFDNRTDRGTHNRIRYLRNPQSFGYSRILQIDPKTQRIVWRYEGTLEAPFYTSIQGTHQTLKNGNVLIVETEGGRVFEVEKKKNAIVWEFRNILRSEESDLVLGRVTNAKRVSRNDLHFLQ